ncbi:MAG TPA: NAD(P)-dependent oxidoreductase [Chloroflexi bacterium]|nr:NAD(P)-dependent oxidoreductase [Chloroflexota bacterium]
MKVLVTGAFGNIGRSAVGVLLERGHYVRCFDVPSKPNRRAAKRLPPNAEAFWGDLRSLSSLEQAVEGMDVVVHLAFVIPTLSATGKGTEDNPAWARDINVGGTANLIRAMQAQSDPPRLIFSSSMHIYGKTQHLTPPRKITDLPNPIEHYAHHKVECEQMIRESGLTWVIFRLGAALPVRFILDPAMFEVPLDNRIEFVHRRDVGEAIANALETEEAWGHIWHIGGGPACQLYQRQLVEQVLEAVGIGMLPEEAFTDETYPTDWLDTTESQRVLRFQRRTLADYIQELRGRLGFRRELIRIFRPIIRLWVLSKSRARA